ncbi:unnamed protein product, partial [marine sediment metagenome]
MLTDVENSMKILKRGGIILYPTDTIWGLGCDATNEKAVNKIYKVKKRKDARSLLILVNSPQTIKLYVDYLPDISPELIERTESPLT